MEKKKKISLNYTVLESDEGYRVDQVVARQFTEYSRGHIQKWIKEGDLLVNGKEVKPKQALMLEDIVKDKYREEQQLVEKEEDITHQIIPELNKIDLPASDIEKTNKLIEEVLGIDTAHAVP